METKKKETIGSWLVILALFLATNIEWNYIQWYLKFAPYDLYALIGTLAIASLCYFRSEDIKSFKYVSFGIAFAIMAIIGKIGLKSNQIFLFSIIGFFVIYLGSKIKFSVMQGMLSAFWLGLFYFYWTFDVKGFFKGYDVYYGSIILFTGFVFTFIFIEYIKFYIKSVYSGKNKLISFLSTNDYLISCFQVFMVAWAYNIMSWYQSKMAFVYSMVFVALMILPKRIKKTKKDKDTNYFARLSVCGVIAFLLMFICSNEHLELISMPFVLSVICLLGIGRGFYELKVSENYTVFDGEEYRKYVKENWKTKALIAGIAALTVLVPTTVLAPLENYYPNIKDFTFSVGDFYPYFIKWTVVITLACVIAGISLRKPAFKLFCVLLFSLGLTTYVQTMVLNRKLSESNGERLNMESLGNYPTINFIIWIVIFSVVCIILYKLKDRWKSVVIIAGGGLCLVQIIAAVSLPFSFVSRDRSMSYELSAADEFEIGKNDNIIVFVIDTLGSVQYDNALVEYPELKEYFSDFKYYDNADCSYGWTMPSMTHMLTGNDVDFEAAGLYEWQYDSWNSDRVTQMYQKLHDAGYKTGLYTGDISYTFGDGENLVGKYDNIQKYEHIVDKEKVRNQMFRFSMLKVLPYSLKARYRVNMEDFAGCVIALHDENDRVADYSTIQFYNWLKNGLKVSDSYDNELKIIHFDGMHAADVHLDENLDETTDNTKNQMVVANLKLVKLYIDEMKELGRYDDATIIITADHGTHLSISDPQPILFVKYKGEKRDKLEYSHAPVSHNELMPTILNAAGIGYSDYGLTYADIKEDEERERTCGYLSIDQDVYSFYTYTGDREELLKKFPDAPDYTKDALK